eukprot:501729-Pleurochrysis_carterae.AAC.1
MSSEHTAGAKDKTDNTTTVARGGTDRCQTEKKCDTVKQATKAPLKMLQKVVRWDKNGIHAVLDNISYGECRANPSGMG